MRLGRTREETDILGPPGSAANQPLLEAEPAPGVQRWEYQVKRIGEDKQRGILGSGRMEQILNGEGQKGWELVTINEERATFKRPLR